LSRELFAPSTRSEGQRSANHLIGPKPCSEVCGANQLAAPSPSPPALVRICNITVSISTPTTLQGAYNTSYGQVIPQKCSWKSSPRRQNFVDTSSRSPAALEDSSPPATVLFTSNNRKTVIVAPRWLGYRLSPRQLTLPLTPTNTTSPPTY
jgi:hypothetical protein